MNYPLTTSLKNIYDKGNPSLELWGKYVKRLDKSLNVVNAQHDTKPILYAQICDAMDLEYALWATQAEPQYNNTWRRFYIWYSREETCLLPTTVNALNIAEEYIDGNATDQELIAACNAASVAIKTSPMLEEEEEGFYRFWAANMTAVNVASIDLFVKNRLLEPCNYIETHKRQHKNPAEFAFCQLVTFGTLP